MSVVEAVQADLEAWGITGNSDGQRALVLAAALDDRAGVVNIAATDKRLGELLNELRERYAPRKRGRLELLRGDAEPTAG